eukprot:14177364-Heterocapsa_arctica.AAC.1
MGQGPLEGRKATAAGVNYGDWYGNKQAAWTPKEGAEKHGYTMFQMNIVTGNVYLAQRAQEHMIRTYKKYVVNPLVRKDIEKMPRLKEPHQERRADLVLGLNSLDMKSRLVENLSIAED